MSVRKIFHAICAALMLVALSMVVYKLWTGEWSLKETKETYEVPSYP